MTIQEWIKISTNRLNEAGIPTARLDCIVLLEDTTRKDRAWLLANPNHALTRIQQERLNKLLSLRMKHKPLAYLRGKTEFYGREFIVSEAVLEPRPESETMIDALLELPDRPKKCRIADVGSGSGAIGITAALELPESEVDLIELDEAALKVSKINVDLFTLNISIIKSNLLEDAKDSYDILLCNLPYVPDDFHINTAATHEPKLAIFGGPDGLDLYRRLFNQLKDRPLKPLYILTESLPTQHKQLSIIASKHDYNLLNVDDFIQVFRIKA